VCCAVADAVLCFGGRWYGPLAAALGRVPVLQGERQRVGMKRNGVVLDLGVFRRDDWR